MIRDGITYERLPADKTLECWVIHTPYSEQDKLSHTRQLIELVHEAALKEGCTTIYVGELKFHTLNGLQHAYTTVGV